MRKKLFALGLVLVLGLVFTGHALADWQGQVVIPGLSSGFTGYDPTSYATNAYRHKLISAYATIKAVPVGLGDGWVGGQHTMTCCGAWEGYAYDYTIQSGQYIRLRLDSPNLFQQTVEVIFDSDN